MTIIFSFNFITWAEDCEWCWFRFCGDDVCFDGCLVPPGSQPLLWVEIHDVLLNHYDWQWVLCVIGDGSCDDPCVHYTAKFLGNSLDPDEEFTGRMKVQDLWSETLCYRTIATLTPIQTQTPTPTMTP